MHLDRPATENAEQHATKLTKRYLVKPLWVLIVPFLFPSALAAEPSLAETIQYIEAKISGATDNGFSSTFRLNGRNIIYRTRAADNEWGETYTFQLDVLSTTVDVVKAFHSNAKKHEVKVSCARGVCISKKSFRIYRGERREESVSVGGVSFWVLSMDVERVQKALTHAIKLSGGKDELF